MEIARPDVQDRHKRVPLIDTHSTHSPKRIVWLFPSPLVEEKGQSTGLLRRIHERKAARMYKQYACQNPSFFWENRRAQFVMLNWLALNCLQRKVKRAFDLLIVFCGMPFVLPIMLITAVLIKLESPGPVFFHQQRVGKWGRRFTCFKFRSMCVDAEARKVELMALNEADAVVFKIKHDPRITRVGHVIRKLSIDELPQIFNVIKGDMSIVGPRPPVPGEVEEYTFDIFQRLNTIPGITGLQQVSGRSNLTFKRWVECDIEYIQTQSLRKDLEILLKTIPAVISGKGAY